MNHENFVKLIHSQVCTFHLWISYVENMFDIDKCVDEWSTNLWMNEYHTNFASSYKFVCQMCFQCTISVHEMYKLWMNKCCTIFITKSWDAKFVMRSRFVDH
jgi:hypothetical protein